MPFNSIAFVVVALATFALWLRLGPRGRPNLLLVASWLLYAGFDPRYLPLLLFTTCLDWGLGLALGRAQSARARNLLLLLSLAGNLGILVYFKYWHFLLASVGWVPAAQELQTQYFHHARHIPAGLSFYTFQSLSYTIDVYRRHTVPCRSLRDFALYVAFFPQLMAGPIVRSDDFLPQIARNRTPGAGEVALAVELFLIGLVKKVVIADNLGLAVDVVFRRPDAFTGASLLLGGVLFWAQVYCDFSGYSTMAQGLARLFGYELPRNFGAPLLATDPLAYRRAWHITMSEWFRDYVFHPLGGTRAGPWRVAFNLLVLWALFGLWHGAGWTFLAWGVYNGVIQAANRERLRRGWQVPAFPGRTLGGWLVNLAFTVPSAVMFRASNFEQGWRSVARAVTLDGAGRAVAWQWLAAIVLLGGIHLVAHLHYREGVLARRGELMRGVMVGAATALVLVFGVAERPFVYFQF
jgi:D-alanyl-lipoteichoic acid acyltransferase DltB (MBOAT superfamily)